MLFTPYPHAPTSRGGQVSPPTTTRGEAGEGLGVYSGTGAGVGRGGGMGREPTREGPACPAAPAALVQGPTWGGVRARSGHRVVQRRQLALHAAEALSEAGLLPLQHLL